MLAAMRTTEAAWRAVSPVRTEEVVRFVAVFVTVATDAAAGATGAAEAVGELTATRPPERPIARIPVAARRAGAADMNVMSVGSRRRLRGMTCRIRKPGCLRPAVDEIRS